MDLGESFDKQIQNYRYHKSEEFKWKPILLGAFVLGLAASGIKELIVRNADNLGGKQTVETFFIGNLIKFVVLLAAIAAFVFVFTKTWKGRASSIEQLVFTLGGGAVLVIFAVMALGALAQRLAAPVLTFDREKQRFTDNEAANALLAGPPVRKGWEEFEKL